VVGRELNLAMRWCQASPPYIYIYGGLSWKLGATSKRRAMGVKERLTRRSGTKRDVSERYELRGFFIEL
jgi:hypothetical protein